MARKLPTWILQNARPLMPFPLRVNVALMMAPPATCARVFNSVKRCGMTAAGKLPKAFHEPISLVPLVA